MEMLSWALKQMPNSNTTALSMQVQFAVKVCSYAKQLDKLSHVHEYSTRASMVNISLLSNPKCGIN
jgi:hypothetical protein